MANKPTIPVRAGEVLRVKKITAAIVGGGTAELRSPAGRQLVVLVLVLGVSDPDVPFHVEPMLGALGYVPETSVKLVRLPVRDDGCKGSGFRDLLDLPEKEKGDVKTDT